MPRSPEPLSTLKSLSGLSERAGIEDIKNSKQDPSLESLRVRTEDYTEEIEAQENDISKEQEIEEIDTIEITSEEV
jgi:hypothetical protein